MKFLILFVFSLPALAQITIAPVEGAVRDPTGAVIALTTQNTSGSGSGVLRPNNNGHSAALDGSIESRLNKYFNTSVFSQPAPFTFGNTGRTLPDVRYGA